MRITTLFGSLAVLFVFAAAGCQDPAENDPVALESVVPKFANAVNSVDDMELVMIDGKKWLAVGGPSIPPDMPVPYPPEPYNPRKHGPPLKNSMARKNLLLQRGYRPPPKADHILLRDVSPNSALANRTTRQGERGQASFILLGGPAYGMLNAPQIHTNFPIPSFYPNAFIYSNTDLPYGHSCIEATTIHRVGGMDEKGFYNWCAGYPGHWLSLERIDCCGWTDRYARYNGGGDLYNYEHIRRVPNTDCWEALIFNFAEMEYESRTPLICGTGHREYGWTSWESWQFMEEMDNVGDCPNLISVGNSVFGISGHGTNREYYIPVEDIPRMPQEEGVCFTDGYYDFRLVPLSKSSMMYF